MAFGQTESQQGTTQGQTNQTQSTAPEKAKKYGQEQTQAQSKPETATSTETGVKSRGQGLKATEPGTRATTNETNVSGTTQTTTVNKQEWRSHHSEVFSLGRHPKEFFVQKYGASHVRLIGNTYYAFVDGCWVSVDVDGFMYSQRVICVGDPDFVEVD